MSLPPSKARRGYGAAADSAPCGLVEINDAGQVRSANKEFLHWVGRPPEAVLGRDLTDLLSSAGRVFWLTHLAPQLRLTGRLDEISLPLPDATGGVRRCLLSARRLLDTEGATLVLLDAGRRHRSEDGVARLEAVAGMRAHWLGQVERMAEVGAWSWDPVLRVFDVSDQVLRLLGLRPKAPLGLDDVLGRLTSAPLRARLGRLLTTPEVLCAPLDLEAEIVIADEQTRQIRIYCEALWEKGKVARVQGVLADISRAHRDRQRLWQLAHLDEVTGLANRQWFRSQLANVCDEERELALLLIDLPDFAGLIDDYGEDRTDAMLREVGERLAALLPAEGLAARVAGEEFALLAPLEHAVGNACGADALAQRLAADVQATLRAPLARSDAAVQLRASIGMAVRPVDAREPEELWGRAKAALSEVKRAGRGGAAFLRGPTLCAVEARRATLAMVREAEREGRIEAWYQPKIRLSDGRVTGHEALARIRCPDGEISTPGDWWDAFDDPDCAALIDAAVLRRVLSDLAEASAHLGRVAVNFSDHSLHRSSFAPDLLAKIAAAGLTPEQIELEVVETALLGQNTENLIAGFALLRAAGVTIALDDFGTGFASLTHLRDLPVDRIKIDKSFVLGAEAKGRNGPILRAIMDLAQGLALATVAEGVESEQTTDLLRALGCNEVQGFHFCRPQPLVHIDGARKYNVETSQTASYTACSLQA
ncbi:diguanylate cyclase (GGDEF)-like protein [Rhodobacter aestuarii]|uniref:Diguanylate cyclase (GGDEF) domain-containing protein n=1 Tax=Rhodobacter aestuarii TaxID=453582 RepID=A0A1N7QFK5_9RHOB|nr:EAL domain-containing protein [Rhodobacter aestuarii]PTV93490.1 diguanylate cyclase (GGDEF)-like protein [Rhodobacter aestuarii]SIT21594.1 diguanylate cyclase (GGDEF) domain-containing protein [Rhodobacter aestuarii]